MPFRLLAALACLLGSLSAQTGFYPLHDVRPGQRAVGRTVFQGEKIEEFQVEILGVLENLGPKQSIILGRLSGGPLAQTGVMQGMSGSPVYLDGRLVGAVAMAFPFAKEAIAGIRPIEQMLNARPPAAVAPPPSQARLTWEPQLVTRLLPGTDHPPQQGRLIDIATPVSFSGFTRGTIDQFAPQLRAMGLEPQQAMAGGGSPRSSSSNPAALQPGAMISVQLVTGDMSIGADGTVTYVDNRRVYAFGHPFLSVGTTELPFARASVLTLLPNLSTSFKISSAREWMGAITEDRSAAVSGEIGRRPALLPVRIDVAGPLTGGPVPYRMEMVNDRALTPFLLQMAVYSTIEATQRTFGTGSFRLRGRFDFEGNTPPIVLDNLYAGDFAVPLQVSLGSVMPLAYVLQSGFDAMKLKDVSLVIEAANEKKQWQIDQVWASPREARPGDTIQVTAALTGDNGRELTRTVSYKVPTGAPVGPLYVTVADGSTANLTDYQQLAGATPRTAGQLIELINSVRSNGKGYVRFWRAEPSFQVQGGNLTDPPPSVALILGKPQTGLGTAGLPLNAKLAEVSFTAGEGVITGSKTIQIEVKD